MKKLVLFSLVFLMSIPVLKSQNEEAPEIESFGKNNVVLMLSDVVMKRISFEYEHVLGDKGNIAINVPMSYSIDKQPDIYDDEVNWWVGLGMKLYPTGQGKIRYYVGPEVRVISAHETNTVYYDGWSKIEEKEYMHTAFLLNNGMIYEPSEHFVFGVNLGLGIMSRDSDDTSYGSVMPMATPSVRLGIRF